MPCKDKWRSDPFQPEKDFSSECEGSGKGVLVDRVFVVTPPSRGETHEKCGCFKAPPAGLMFVYRLHASKL